MAFYDEEIAQAGTPRELREAIENELATWYDSDMSAIYITSDTLGTAVSVALFIRGRHLNLDFPDVPSDIAGLLNWCINCEKIMAEEKVEAKKEMGSRQQNSSSSQPGDTRKVVIKVTSDLMVKNYEYYIREDLNDISETVGHLLVLSELIKKCFSEWECLWHDKFENSDLYNSDILRVARRLYRVGRSNLLSLSELLPKINDKNHSPKLKSFVADIRTVKDWTEEDKKTINGAKKVLSKYKDKYDLCSLELLLEWYQNIPDVLSDIQDDLAQIENCKRYKIENAIQEESLEEGTSDITKKAPIESIVHLSSQGIEDDISKRLWSIISQIEEQSTDRIKGIKELEVYLTPEGMFYGKFIAERVVAPIDRLLTTIESLKQFVPTTTSPYAKEILLLLAKLTQAVLKIKKDALEAGVNGDLSPSWAHAKKASASGFLKLKTEYHDTLEQLASEVEAYTLMPSQGDVNQTKPKAIPSGNSDQAVTESAKASIKKAKPEKKADKQETEDDKPTPPPIDTEGVWTSLNLTRLREIDSNEKRNGIAGDKKMLKRLKEYLKRSRKRKDIAETLYPEDGRIKTTMPHRSMFKQK